MKRALINHIVLVLCLVGLSSAVEAETLCCGGQEYDSSTQACCEDELIYSKESEGCCAEGDTVLIYNVSSQECCIKPIPDGAKVVDIGHCCSGVEYDPANRCCVPQPDGLANLALARKQSWAALKLYCNYGVPDPNYTLPPPNGCTGVPNSPMPGVSFEGACNTHDGCYATCHSSGSEGQQACDDRFENDMIDACIGAFNYGTQQYDSCIAYAAVYRAGVGALGEGFYGSGQEKACICCEYDEIL